MTPEVTTEPFSKLDAALHYAAEFGWRVFPLHSIVAGRCSCGKPNCSSPGKHPTTKNGVLDATTDEAQIRAWWGALGNPNLNVGIATGAASGLIVVDLDVDKGANLIDLTLDAPPEILNTLTVKTGGGFHYYYRLPAGAEVKNSASKLGKFIDVRGLNGYVVAPPSIHVSGATYSFVDALVELKEFPIEWLERLNQASMLDNRTASNTNDVQSNGSGLFVPPPHSNLIVPGEINQGARNAQMTQIAGSMRRIGFDKDEIEAALSKLNARVCQPPLDASEINYIAHSVSRYKPNDVIDAATDALNDADKADYENTLTPYSLETFFDIDFPEKEILGFHIGARDIAVIQAATNAGKTTLLRNVALCMAAGRRFAPFFDGGRPIRIAYFDFENDAQDVQRDLKEMFGAFTPVEQQVLKKNFIVIPKGLMGGELFQFNTHEKWANSLIELNKIEFILVDNVSAAYDLNDENSNAEVTKKVIKPLLKMAYKGDCAFLFAHHYGKGKNELEHAGVHAGRGASALQALSKTVINMFGDVSKGDPVTVECAKRKSDGGQNYTEVFKLQADRWFHHTTIVPPPKKRTAYQTIRSFMETIVYPSSVAMADVISKFENDFSEIGVKKAVNELFKDGFIEKPKHGFYCAKDLAKSTSGDGAAQSIKVSNFYEKDDDDSAKV